MNKKISIIMPVKDGEKYLKEALQGIQKQNMDTEIIVVNDGSSDNTEQIAKDFGCVVITKEKSEGPVKAKNDALKIAKGDYIMFHDGDDIMNDNVLLKMYEELERDTSIFAVMAKVKDFISPDIPEEEKQKTVVKADAYYGLFTGAILIRKEVFDIIGFFNESIKAGEIIDWQGKMDSFGLKIKKLDLISTQRRLHVSNFGKTQQKTEFKDYAALLRARIMAKTQSGENDNLADAVVSMFRSTSFYNARKQISDTEHQQNVETFLNNFDKKEKERALNLINKLEKTYAKRMVTVKDIYSEEELAQLNKVKQFEKEITNCENGYKWKNFILPIKLFESSVFYYRHGINLIRNKNYIDGKAIIDAGAYIADSALIFREEFPNSAIHCFEPLKSNYELAKKTVELNNLKNIKLINSGLGDEVTTLKIKTFDTNLKNIESTISKEGNKDISVTTIDSYVKENDISVGLIKTDVEGFEQKLLKGAYDTIKTQKPTLLISIYHNYDDFYKIKPLIESWKLGYKFDVFQGVQNSGDITVETLLIAELR